MNPNSLVAAQGRQIQGGPPRALNAGVGDQMTRPTPEIYAEIGYLRNALDQLTSAAHMLIERVGPALSAPSPADGPLPPEVVTTTSLGAEIQALRHTVHGITAAVNDAYERLAF